jgi:ubiquitin carboxyl-terminal hydrolase 7
VDPLMTGRPLMATDDVLYDHKWAADDALGLDHPDKRPNKVGAEKGIVMR